MNAILIIFALLSGAAGVAAHGSASARNAAVSHPPHSSAAAAKVFAKNCAVCHGSNGVSDTPLGKAVNAADLTSTRVQAESNGTLAHVIADGEGQMPAFRDTLTDRQILEQVRYIRVLAKKNNGR